MFKARLFVFIGVLLGGLFAVNVSAIEFITEAQVSQKLGAQKVIEVSKYPFEALLTPGSECEAAFPSRSARAYVVKKGTRAALYLTESGLGQLSHCRNL